MVVPLTEESAKAPSYAFGLHVGGMHAGMATPPITIIWPTRALVRGAVSVTVTVLPASLIVEMPDVELGKLIAVTGPKEGVLVVCTAGEKTETVSTPPKALPALATNSRLLLDSMAACVGLSPNFGSEFEVSAMMESPATSICMAPPGLFGAFKLMPNT